MTVFQIFFVSLLIIVVAVILYVLKKVRVSIKELAIMLVASVFLTSLSWLVSFTKIGGTVEGSWHGWPHWFYNYSIRDILDNTPINHGQFWFGPFGSYVLSNVLFYFAVVFCAFVLKKAPRHLGREAID